jgi:hypothetical protein
MRPNLFLGLMACCQINTFVGRYKMPVKPDLTITHFNIHPLIPPWLPPWPPTLPGVILVTFTVVNIGSAPSKAINPGVYVNAIRFNPPPGQNEIQIQMSLKLPALAPHAGNNFSVAFRIQELKQKRIRRIEIVADPKNVIPETNEYNNYASITIPSY